jgi:parallel beta-helix repeat protein
MSLVYNYIMRILALIMFVLFLSAGFSLSAGTQITQDTVLAGGTYRLSNQDDSSAALTITASNVVLDCNGAAIIGNGKGYGIEVKGVKNAVVKNCTIRNYRTGIQISNSEQSVVADNTLQEQEYGIYVASSNNEILRNKISLSTEAQIYVGQDLRNVTVKYNWDNLCSTLLIPTAVRADLRPPQPLGTPQQMLMPDEERSIVMWCPYGIKRERTVSNASAVATLPGNIASAGAVLAPGGMAYIFGGSGSGGKILKYNTSAPTTNAADTGAKLAASVLYITESAEINPTSGMAYIFGGEIAGTGSTTTNAIQRYNTSNPTANATTVAYLPMGGGEGIGVVINSTGQVLGYGHWNKSGGGSGSMYDNIFQYDTTQDTKDAKDTGAVLPAKGDGLACAITSNDKAYCAGATVQASPYTREIYEHDTSTPSTDAKSVSYMQIGHNVSHASAVTSSNGKIYVIGGVTRTGGVRNTIQEWDPKKPGTDAKVVAYLETGVYGASAVIKRNVVKGGKILDVVYVFGGWTTGGGAMTNKIQRFRITPGSTNTVCNSGTGVCQLNCTTPTGLSGLQDLYVQAETLTYGQTRSDTESNAINYS